MSVETGRIARVHWLSAGAGAVLLLLGIGVMLAPSLADAIPLSDALLVPAALIGLVLGIWRVRVRYNTRLQHTELPVPELSFSLPTPGDELDDMIYRYTHFGEATLEYPERIGERLREVAIAAICNRENTTRDEAIDRLEEGSWTDDTRAAAYFSTNIGIPPMPLATRVKRALGRGEHPYTEQIRAVVDAIVTFSDVVDRGEKTENDQHEEQGFFQRFRSGDEDPLQAAERIRGRKTVFDYSPDDGHQLTDTHRYHDTVWTGRWLGIEAFALVAATIGIITVSPGLILVAGVAIVYAAFSHAEQAPALTGLRVDRTVNNSTPAPGEEVVVTVTVKNEGKAFLPDLRLVDLLPPNMRVIDGSPRVYTALRSGSESTFRYTVIAERGNHEWPLLAVGAGFSGSIEREAIINPSEDNGTISCLPLLRTVAKVPVRMQTTVYEGGVETTKGGAGLEFHSVREYQPNDPLRRIDWKRMARTGELATIDLRIERAANVVLLFDARESGYVASGPGNAHALDRSVAAANDVYAALADAGDLVGIAAFDTVPCWLAPGAGSAHDERARQLLAYHPALTSIPPQYQDVEGGYIDPMNHVRRQLPASAQVMLFSPLVSDYAAEVARRLDSAGHRVTIISPDPTNTRTAGQRLGRLERALRVNRIREHGIAVIDWKEDESLALTFERANRRRMYA